MAEPAKKSGFLKAGLGAMLGLFSGAAAMYATALVDKVIKPPKPVANFAVAAEGLTVTVQNHASGESGWWDFGDGSPLEPFDAAQPTVTHAYAKPGSYAVKLVVRNFLMEENDRSVPVDLTGAPQPLPPTVALSVEPVNPTSVAPATFRIKGEVKNADRVFVDIGDRIEVANETGPFERLVVFEKPGQFPIQLIGHTGKQATKQSAVVTVTPPATGSVSVVLRVADVGTRVDRQVVPGSTVFAPTKGAKPPEHPFPARAGYTIKEAKLGTVKGSSVKNLKVEVAADGKSARLVGEWAGDPAKGGAETMAQVSLIQEKVVAVQMPAEAQAASFPMTGGRSAVSLKVMPTRIAGAQRRMQLEFQEATPTGVRKLLTVPDMALPWTGSLANVGGRPGAQPVTATLVGDAVQVTFGQ